MPDGNRRVLVIAPHMDDEVLGAGGTIVRHVKQGDEVMICIVANRVYEGKYDTAKNAEEKKHALAAKDVLGYQAIKFLDLDDERLDIAVQEIIKPLEKVVNGFSPETVYSNFYGDNNQDHRAVFSASRVVLRPSATPFIERWFLYETPSSTDQSPHIPSSFFSSNHYVDISETFNLKIAAYRCYETERRSHPHPRSEKAIEALAIVRGSRSGFDKAESFITMRSAWKR